MSATAAAAPDAPAPKSGKKKLILIIAAVVLLAGGGLGMRALGTGAPCGSPGGGPANACDPYCNAFVDDPVQRNHLARVRGAAQQRAR